MRVTVSAPAPVSVSAPVPAGVAGRGRSAGVLVVVLAVLLALFPAAFTPGASAGTAVAAVVGGDVEASGSTSVSTSASVSVAESVSVFAPAPDGPVEFTGYAGDGCATGSVHLRVRHDNLTERPAAWNWHATAAISHGPAPPALGRTPLPPCSGAASPGRERHDGNRAPPVSSGI